MKNSIKTIVCIFSMLLLTSCVGVNRNYVSYSVYPVGYLLERIGQNRIRKISVQENVLIQTANPVAEYKDILKSSQYFFHIGDLEPYFTLYVDDFQESGAQIIDLSTLNAIYGFKRYTVVYVDGKETYIEGDYYNGDEFNSIDKPEKDLFLWLDPISMLSMAKDVVETLGSNYIEENDFFLENYKKLEEELVNLDASYQKLSTKLEAEHKTVKFVSMTNSFGNWQKAYGFQVYPISLSKYGALPNKAQLELIKKRILEDNVKFIAYEPNMDIKMQALFNELETELNLTRVNLSNLSSLTDAQLADNKDYMSIMYENLTILENMATDDEKIDSSSIKDDSKQQDENAETESDDVDKQTNEVQGGNNQ